MKAKLYFACAVVVFAYAFGWLLGGEGSPLSEYFLWHATIPNWWMAVNVVPAIVAAIAAGNPHSGDETIFHLAFTAQWFALGYAVASLSSSFRKRLWKPI